MWMKLLIYNNDYKFMKEIGQGYLELKLTPIP